MSPIGFRSWDIEWVRSGGGGGLLTPACFSGAGDEGGFPVSVPSLPGAGIPVPILDVLIGVEDK